MNKLHAVLLGVALTLPWIVAGCAVGASVGGVEVVSVKLEDWKNPEDGKLYVVAMPTWKNSSDQAIRQVVFAAEIEGLDSSKQPNQEPKEPQFSGGIADAGVTITPAKVPEEGVVLGVKEDLQKEIGSFDASKVKVIGIGSDKEYVPPKDSGA